VENVRCVNCAQWEGKGPGVVVVSGVTMPRGHKGVVGKKGEVDLYGMQYNVHGMEVAVQQIMGIICQRQQPGGNRIA